MWTLRHSKSSILQPSNSPNLSDDDSHYQRDRARIIHASSFRSLQSKTQVLGLGESDFYRTRLTHSLEVAQIGSGIAELLRSKKSIQEEQRAWIPSFSLIEAICLAHDIGHPPFGHGGEIATNYLMRNHGGFEANGQTLRILTRLGEYSEHDGLDLTRRALLGTIKYPAFYDELLNPNVYGCEHSTSNLETWHPPKCLFREEEAVLNWILQSFSESDRKTFRTYRSSPDSHSKTLHKALDTSIMELADDIAYGVHDLEDAIALNLLSRYQWQSSLEEFLSEHKNSPLSKDFDFYTEKLFSQTNKGRKHGISKLVRYLMRNIDIKENTQFTHPLLRFQVHMEPNAYELLYFLKTLVMHKVIMRPELKALQFKGQKVIIDIFSALADAPAQLLPEDIYQNFKEQDENLRIICDYVSSMTDISAGKLYHKLFTPSTGSIFDRM